MECGGTYVVNDAKSTNNLNAINNQFFNAVWLPYTSIGLEKYAY